MKQTYGSDLEVLLATAGVNEAIVSQFKNTPQNNANIGKKRVIKVAQNVQQVISSGEHDIQPV